MTLVYSKPTANTFIRAMKAIGLECRHYQGRYWWRGPAVVVGRDREQEIKAAAHNAGILIQSDHMGKDLVFYPTLPGGEPITNKEQA